jgi:hypothetical protein
VKHSVSNGKRHVSNVNKRAKMFAVCAWTQIAVYYKVVFLDFCLEYKHNNGMTLLPDLELKIVSD